MKTFFVPSAPPYDPNMSKIDSLLKLLAKQYPRARIALEFTEPWQLLVATILSAQCTDKRVNMVTPMLFKKYRRIEDVAQADHKTLENDIRSTGFYRHKAKNIIAAARRIVGDFGARVPSTLEELVTLPGVARKTANVVLYSAFGRNEGIAVDTHVARVARRLGLTSHDDPVKIERDLMPLVPRAQWGDFSLRLIAHGRAICQARRPQCPACVLGGVCPSRKIFFPRGNPARRGCS